MTRKTYSWWESTKSLKEMSVPNESGEDIDFKVVSNPPEGVCEIWADERPTKCTCYLDTIMSQGCQCGGE